MTDSNGRNSNDTTTPGGLGTTTARPAGTTGGSGSAAVGGIGSTGTTGVASTAGAATAPKPRRAAPAKAGATTAGPGASPQPAGGGSKTGSARTTVRDEASKLKNDATTKARDYANQGKQKATSALDNLADMLKDTAAEVDERMGEQYGRYARSAADSVSGFSSTIRQKEVDELLADARDLVRRSPAVAIGAAAAVGFVLARLIKSGIEPRDENEVEFEPDPAMQGSSFDDDLTRG